MTFAEDYNAPDKVIELLDRLPEGVFNTASEVITAAFTRHEDSAAGKTDERDDVL